MTTVEPDQRPTDRSFLPRPGHDSSRSILSRYSVQAIVARHMLSAPDQVGDGCAMLTGGPVFLAERLPEHCCGAYPMR